VLYNYPLRILYLQETNWNVTNPLKSDIHTVVLEDSFELRISLFMEPWRSLPQSQEPVLPPLPEPDQSSSYTLSQFLKVKFNIILPSIPKFFKWSLSIRFTHPSPVCTSPISATRPVRIIFLDITWILYGEE